MRSTLGSLAVWRPQPEAQASASASVLVAVVVGERRAGMGPTMVPDGSGGGKGKTRRGSRRSAERARHAGAADQLEAAVAVEALRGRGVVLLPELDVHATEPARLGPRERLVEQPL